MCCLYKHGAAHTHTHTHTHTHIHLHIVYDVRNSVRAHQISLKWFCSLTSSHDFIYLYIKALPEQAAFIFKAFFFLQFFPIESPFTSNGGCVRLIMSKVSRKVVIALSFLIFALGCDVTTTQSFTFRCAVFIKQWGFPKKHNAYLLLCFSDESVSAYSHQLLV